jgi:transcriptional regulator with XRE-family HTH domain
VDSQEGALEAADTPAGRRLEAFVRSRWTRQQGGIQGLASAIGSSTETVYSWFRGDAEPSMAHLRTLAEKLGATRSELVAILDGDQAAQSVELDPEQLEVRLRALEAAVALLGLEAGEALRERRAPQVKAG